MDLEQFKQTLNNAKTKIEQGEAKATSAAEFVAEENKKLKNRGLEYRFVIDFKRHWNGKPSFVINFVDKFGRKSPILYDSMILRDRLDKLSTLAENISWWCDDILFAPAGCYDNWEEFYVVDYNDANRYFDHKIGIFVDGQLYDVRLCDLFDEKFASLEDFLATAKNVWTFNLKLPQLVGDKEFMVKFDPEAKTVELSGHIRGLDKITDLPRGWKEFAESGKYQCPDLDVAQKMIKDYEKIHAAAAENLPLGEWRDKLREIIKHQKKTWIWR